MSKRMTPEEEEKFIQKLTANDFDGDYDKYLENVLGPSKKRRKSLKTPIEKVRNYNSIVEDSVFWASRQVYLEMLQSFLLRKIDAGTLTSKFSELRNQDMINTDELCAIIEDQIPPIPDLYYTSKATDFSSAIHDLYEEMDRCNPNLEDDIDSSGSDWYDSIVYTQSQLRSLIQEKFVPRFQKSCDLNDSFFRPQVDLD